MKKIISTNPADNYKVIGEVVSSTNQEIDRVVSLANQARIPWRNLGVYARVELLKKGLEIFIANQSKISSIISQEIGTPLSEVEGEVSWDWGYWQWFLDNASVALSPETTHESATALHELHYEPLGSVAVITPWNLPFDLFVWGVIPNLLAGNTVIYKAAEECVLSGQLFGQLMEEIGLPTGVFNIIHGDGAEGKYLVNSQVDAVWFTGSTEVGQQIFETAGKKFIRTMLELGGSNPVIVCKDADLELAANSIISKRFMFNGQTCDADKRLIVHKSIKDELVQLLVEKLKKIPTLPLVSAKQLDLISKQVNDSIAMGAKIIVGGDVATELKGAYYASTLLDNIKPDMPVWREEVFGPVLPIISFTTNEEALALANNTIYGLGSQVFTKNKEVADYFAHNIQAGNVDINGVGHFIPQNPFGGYKNSGMGREHGIYGFRELCQIKTISRPK